MKTKTAAVVLVYLTVILTASSCKKDEIPQKEFKMSVDGSEIEMSYASIDKTQGVYYLSAATDGSSSTINCNLGTIIKDTYSIQQAPFFGYKDSVIVKTGGSRYMVNDSLGPFNLSITGTDQQRSGSFSGSLLNTANQSISVTGTFKNI